MTEENETSYDEKESLPTAVKTTLIVLGSLVIGVMLTFGFIPLLMMLVVGLGSL